MVQLEQTLFADIELVGACLVLFRVPQSDSYLRRERQQLRRPAAVIGRIISGFGNHRFPGK